MNSTISALVLAVLTAILSTSDKQPGDAFGSYVAIDGDTAIVGAQSESGGPGDPATGAGAAYVLSRNVGGANNWGEVKILHASDAQQFDTFGVSVAIDGDTAVVGAHVEDGGTGDPAENAGAAYVFSRNAGGANNWGEVKILHPSDAQSRDRFGYSVSVAGDIIFVCAYLEDGGPGDPVENAGAVYVFSRNAGGANNWGEVKILRASDAQTNDYFGWSVAIDGDTAVIGAWGEDGGPGDPVNGAGAAYVFSRNAGGADNWGEVEILHASNPSVYASFGQSVEINGDTTVVGAPSAHAPGPVDNAGVAYVFGRNVGGADNWGQVSMLHASDAQSFDQFGISLGLDGDYAVVGAWHEDGGAGDPAEKAGAAYVFGRNVGGADNWGEVSPLRAPDAQLTDYFGYSVGIDGNVAFVGSVYEDGGAGDPLLNAGAVYVFRLRRPAWNDYNGDGISDLAIYNPTLPAWYIRRIDNLSAPPLAFGLNWGGSTLEPVSGDYNGDGTCDPAVYKETPGKWFIRQMQSGQPPVTFGQEWGGSGLSPVPGDYNGDGLFDLALFEMATGRWFIRSLGDPNAPPIAFSLQWGGANMTPVPGDYNNDGIYDLACYDGTTGNWYIRRIDDMSAPPITFGQQWGGSGLIPVAGDYNGDGLFDLAVYKASNGKWFIRSLGNPNAPPITFGQQWGGSGTVPVPGDYDGDGLFDLGVQDPSTGNWFISRLGSTPPTTIIWGFNWGSAATDAVGASE